AQPLGELLHGGAVATAVAGVGSLAGEGGALAVDLGGVLAPHQVLPPALLALGLDLVLDATAVVLRATVGVEHVGVTEAEERGARARHLDLLLRGDRVGLGLAAVRAPGEQVAGTVEAPQVLLAAGGVGGVEAHAVGVAGDVPGTVGAPLLLALDVVVEGVLRLL